MTELIKVKKDINNKIDCLVSSLDEFATKQNLDVMWVLETFTNKLAYRVQELEIKRQ